MRNGLAIPLLLIALTFVYYLEKEPEPIQVVRYVEQKEPTEVDKSWANLKNALSEAFTDTMIDIDKAVFGDLFDKKNLRSEKR